MNLRDPLDLACLLLLGVLVAAGAIIPAIVLFAVIFANIVDRAVTK